MSNQITCPLCGHTYDAVGNAACQSCPVHGGCAMACCPNCGHTTINPSQSGVVKMLSWMFSPSQHAPQPDALRRTAAPALSLAEARPGQSVRVTGIAATLTPGKKAHLLAYGLTPGQQVTVLQHAPVTIVQVEFTELALEAELARAIQITASPS